MKIQNKMNATVFFPYAGVAASLGRDLGPDAISGSIEFTRLQNPMLRRDWEAGKISIIVEPNDFIDPATRNQIDELNNRKWEPASPLAVTEKAVEVAEIKKEAKKEEVKKEEVNKEEDKADVVAAKAAAVVNDARTTILEELPTDEPKRQTSLEVLPDDFGVMKKVSSLEPALEEVEVEEVIEEEEELDEDISLDDLNKPTVKKKTKAKAKKK